MKKTALRRAVVFMDLDGTISDSHRPPTPRVADAIRELRQNGHLVYFCTGRALCHIGPEYGEIGCDGLITLTGAHIVAGGRKLYEALWPDDLARRVLEVCQKESISCTIENNLQAIHFSPTGEISPWAKPTIRSAEELYALYPHFRIAKMALFHRDLPRFRAYEDQYGGRLVFMHTGGEVTEATLTGVDKGSGIRRVLDYLGRDLAGTYGIGDSENDFGMLDTVETGIAMGNAAEELKRRADYVTSTVGEDGVYWALRHFGLIEA